jgi:hypothetical protein
VDVGFGNSVFIRGQGGGLSWDRGIPLACIGPSIWIWETRQLSAKATFKLLLNDSVWSDDGDLSIAAGNTMDIIASFSGIQGNGGSATLGTSQVNACL